MTQSIDTKTNDFDLGGGLEGTEDTPQNDSALKSFMMQPKRMKKWLVGGSEQKQLNYSQTDFIYPLIESGNALSANTGLGLECVLQSVPNDEGVRMVYDMHPGVV